MIGVDDEQYGQRLVAFVVLEPGRIGDAGHAEAACAGELGQLQGAARHHDSRRVAP